MAETTSPEPLADDPPDRRRRRHEETKKEILEAAWALAARDGVGALSLRELADAVGMKAPSLYTYFGSKEAIYDAMFAQGWRALAERFERMESHPTPDDPFKAEAREFYVFCTEDPARYQLMFQRPMPDFEPSSEAYASSVEVFEGLRRRFATRGIEDSDAIELWTLLMTGITARQIANDPEGDRYAHHLEGLVDMYLAHIQPRTQPKRRGQ